jgi:hypothetical protein
VIFKWNLSKNQMNRRSNSITEVSNKVSFYALICLIIIFLIIITYGWSTMLAPAISRPIDWPDFLDYIFLTLRYLAGAAIGIAGVILAKAVAAERIRINSEEIPKFTNTWKAFFAVLLIISALGTMNTIFMQTQQTSLLGDVISKTRTHLQKLKFKIEENLTTPYYDKQRAEIEQQFANFEKELRNPANCGFGAQSNMRFRELQQALPNLKPLALGSGACQNVDALINAYKETVTRLSDDLPDPATKKRYKQRILFASNLQSSIDTIEDLKVKSANLDKGTALPILTSAWNNYAQTLQEAELIAGKSFGLPTEINDKNAQGMGNITQIIPLLISKFDDPVTYLIIFAAVIFDVLLIEFFARHLHGQVAIRRDPFTSGNSNYTSSKASNLFEE